ncbi:MAG TPA: hypothetical protein V6D20_04585 [Candidatus Obscuribacterales bacterium]
MPLINYFNRFALGRVCRKCHTQVPIGRAFCTPCEDTFAREWDIREAQFPDAEVHAVMLKWLEDRKKG